MQCLPKSAKWESLKFLNFFHQIWWILMKFVKYADGRWSCNCWYSLRNTHIRESICQILSDSKNASRSKSRGVGEDFVSICFLRLRRRRVQTIASRCDFVDFWASRVRGVEKMKKIAFWLGRCHQVWKSRSHAGCGSQKIMTPMQHGSAKIDFCDTSSARTSFPPKMGWLKKFCCCRFWQVQKRVKRGDQQDSHFLINLLKLYEMFGTSKCC